MKFQACLLNSTCWIACKPQIYVQNHRRRNLKPRACSGESRPTIYPLRFVSPAGQLLSHTMHTRPHLLPVIIDQQLEQLRSNQDSAKEEYLVEIIYCIVVQKFIEKNISMIAGGQMDSWPTSQEQKLKAVHSPDAKDMIDHHLNFLDRRSVDQVSMKNLRKLYIDSIRYGYCLKRIDARFQLDRRMETLPMSIADHLKRDPFWNTETMTLCHRDEGDSTNRLRSYVRCIDAETLRRYATVRSKHAISLIERQEYALFGCGSDKERSLGDQEVVIDSALLTTLILEAVAFGSFLWEAERYIKCK